MKPKLTFFLLVLVLSTLGLARRQTNPSTAGRHDIVEPEQISGSQTAFSNG
jgi:hypothetical protein